MGNNEEGEENIDDILGFLDSVMDNNSKQSSIGIDSSGWQKYDPSKFK